MGEKETKGGTRGKSCREMEYSGTVVTTTHTLNAAQRESPIEIERENRLGITLGIVERPKERYGEN